MLVMSRMEEKQLNFETPLLSVRRFSLGATLDIDSKRKTDKSPLGAPRPPRFQSELKSGPVRNPGTVPFSWEQNPGRPKDEIEHKSCVADNRPPTVPKLPSRRSSKVNQQNLSVRKNKAGTIQSLDDKIEQPGILKDEIEDAGSTISGHEKDEECVDDRGTLSKTETFVINCSISGLSGLEDSDTRVSGNDLIDIQTRDLMMCRFLPAAMAATSESPQHPKMLVSDGKKPRLRYGTNCVPEYSRYHYNEDGGSDADSEEHEISPGKVCGILPCLGFTSSLCLVSPLRGMSVRTLAPVSPFRKPRNSEEATDSKGNGSELKKVVRRSFEEFLAEENISNKINARSHVAENTAYVVSEHKVEPPTSKSHDPYIEKQLEGKKHQSFMKSRLFSRERDYYKGCKTVQHEYMHPSAPPASEKLENNSELPFPPPLPTTPSDSWLGRTLPSMSVKKAPLHPYLMSAASPKHQVLKSNSSNPKWQTMVKMTKVPNQHFRYPQDRLTPITEA